MTGESLLSRINSPADLKLLEIKELEKVAGEIRDLIIDTVSKTGGHLAPSLGVVELTLALHKIFDSPKDKIIWDVGHQSYAHKIITGRRDRFHTLRQEDGISGFTRISESPHDAFGTGHSSTSISSALGIACARDQLGESYKVIPIIGDGSMTSGLAFEALNQAGGLSTDLLVVLNDNEMSIDKNVGALSAYLNNIITGAFYNRAKKDIEDLISRIPNIGGRLLGVTHRFEESLKAFIVPGVLFEELGFRYFGPIDGHNMKLLLETFENVKNIKGPILVHALTKKGKGYSPAEKNPTRFHGTGPFDLETGEVYPSGGKAFTAVFGEAICELAEKNQKIVAITAAMAPGTGLVEFSHKFPKRFFDVGIAEPHAVTFAAGLARGGARPVVAVYSTFLQRGVDEIIHDVALQKLPVLFCMDRGGVVGDDGATHQGLFDISYLRYVPNLTFMSPANGGELKSMMAKALTMDSCCAIRYPRDKVRDEDDYVSVDLEIGKAQIVKSGEKVAIWGLGPMVYNALEASEILASKGMDIMVVNPRFIKPLDKELLKELLEKEYRIITVEDHVLQGGFGSAVAEAVIEMEYPVSVLECLGIPDEFVEHGKRSNMFKKYGLDPEGIVKSATRHWEMADMKVEVKIK